VSDESDFSPKIQYLQHCFNYRLLEMERFMATHIPKSRYAIAESDTVFTLIFAIFMILMC